MRARTGCAAAAAVQPAMQALLACELARFVANAFEVIQSDVRDGGQHSAQSGKHGPRFVGVCETPAALLGRSRNGRISSRKKRRSGALSSSLNKVISGGRSHGGARARTDGG